MVKSINPSSHGRFNKKKKKVWIPLNDEEKEDNIEMEVEIIDYENCIIERYDEKGNLILDIKKEKSIIDIKV